MLTEDNFLSFAFFLFYTVKCRYIYQHKLFVFIKLICFGLGVGSQFLALATGIMVMAVLGMFNVHRHGAINSAGIVLYAFTSCKFHLTELWSKGILRNHHCS